MEKNTWLWEGIDLLDANRVAEILSFCRLNDVKVIYTQLSDRVTDPFYVSFITKATQLGIKVHALMGEQEWYHPDNYKHIQKKLDRIKAYQQSVPAEALFTGIQFDIEPHPLKVWETNREKVLEHWAGVVTTYMSFVRSELHIECSAAVPLSISRIKFGDVFFSQFMIDAHDKIVVMSYRDFAEGQDSINYHAEPFITQATEMQRPNSVIVGVETKPITPAKITFAEEGKLAMYREMDIVHATFSSQLSYAGMAVHALKYWMPLFD